MSDYKLADKVFIIVFYGALAVVIYASLVLTVLERTGVW